MKFEERKEKYLHPKVAKWPLIIKAKITSNPDLSYYIKNLKLNLSSLSPQHYRLVEALSLVFF